MLDPTQAGVGWASRRKSCHIRAQGFVSVCLTLPVIRLVVCIVSRLPVATINDYIESFSQSAGPVTY